MDYRTLMVSAVLATGLAGFAGIGQADMVAVDNGIAVRDSGVATPTRGMTMSQVVSKFGDPSSKVPAVGTPPISRWEYPGFVVYFERDHVIHSVVSAASEPSAAPPASSTVPATSTAPATSTPPADSTAPASATPAPASEASDSPTATNPAN